MKQHWFECVFQSRLAGFARLVLEVQGLNEGDASDRAQSLLGPHWAFVSSRQITSLKIVEVDY